MTVRGWPTGGRWTEVHAYFERAWRGVSDHNIHASAAS